MKEEHKELIEYIISEIKKSENGIIHRGDLKEMFPNDNVMSSVLNIIIKNLKLIESVVGESYNFTLTKDGWNFTSFKDIEAKELSLKEKEQLEVDLAISNIEANKLNKEVAERNAKSERFNKKMSILNFIFVICNFGILIWQILKLAK